MAVTVVEADLDSPTHGAAIRDMTDNYARGEFGGRKPLSPEVLDRLVPGLRDAGNAVVFLAFEDGRAVGIATCFTGFSTFRARPLINIHDLAVRASHQGQGIGKQLIEAVAVKARESGHCKLTLEVRSDNRNAKSLYERMGFTGAGPGKGLSFEFWSRDL